MKLKKIVALFLAALTAMTLFAGCGKADKTDLQKVQEKKKMVIGITDFAPMDYKDENGEWTGFDAEFAKEVCARLGVEAEFIEITWDNKALELESGTIDAVWNGMTLTNEVSASMDCSNPYVENQQVVVMAADKVANYTDIESMKGLKFTAEAGSAGEKAIMENGLDANYTAVAAQSDALLEVSSGASDACVIDMTMASAMIGEGTDYASLARGYSFNSAEPEVYVIGFRKGSDLTAKVNEIMADMMADGTLDALAAKYELKLVK